MSKQEADILLIRKYLNGELDDRAMHRLERRAQDDPFLMDAIEGYESAKPDQHKNLDYLTRSLQQRIARKEPRIIPWRILGIAASILVVFTIGGLLLFKNREPVPVKIAQSPSPQLKPSPVIPSHDSVVQDKVIAALVPTRHHQQKQRKNPPAIVEDKMMAAVPSKPNPLASAEVSSDESSNPDADSSSTSLTEMVVMDMTKKRKDTIQGDRIAMKESKIFHQPNVNTALLGKVAGVKSSPADGKPLSGDFDSSFRRIEGMIVDKADGAPLSGVSVRVAGTNTATLTDATGHFKLPVDSNKISLNIGFIGYESQSVSINKHDSLKTIAMIPSNKSLSEVVVVGYGAKRNDVSTIVTAHPKEGWASFRKYLKENAKSSDGKIGIVKLLFTVDHLGVISDINVIKSLSPVADKRAIDLLSNGPEWSGNSNGQTEKITVRIKFTK